MAKILDATCNPAGLVTSEGVTVPDCTVLSEGKAQSSGVMLMEGEKARYLTSSATDIKDSLDSIVAALQEIANTLTAIGAGMTGPTTAPPPTLVTSVVLINQKIVLLTTLKGALK